MSNSKLQHEVRSLQLDNQSLRYQVAALEAQRALDKKRIAELEKEVSRNLMESTRFDFEDPTLLVAGCASKEKLGNPDGEEFVDRGDLVPLSAELEDREESAPTLVLDPIIEDDEPVSQGKKRALEADVESPQIAAKKSKYSKEKEEKGLKCPGKFASGDQCDAVFSMSGLSRHLVSKKHGWAKGRAKAAAMKLEAERLSRVVVEEEDELA